MIRSIKLRNKIIAYIAIAIANPSVKLFALEDQEIVLRLNNAAFGCDRTRRVDVVASHHSNSDSSSLTFLDGVGNFGPNRIFNADDAKACKVTDNAGFIFPVGFFAWTQRYLIECRLASDKVTISNRDGSETVACHRLDDLMQQTLLHIAGENFETSFMSVCE